jgi:hypothetical protein
MANGRVGICPAATETTGGVSNFEILAGQSISCTPETNLSFLTKACIHNIHGFAAPHYLSLNMSYFLGPFRTHTFFLFQDVKGPRS